MNIDLSISCIKECPLMWRTYFINNPKEKSFLCPTGYQCDLFCAQWMLYQQEDRIAELESKKTDYELFLVWRGIEKPCPKCKGAGKIVHGDTACGRGIGGQMVTVRRCQKCGGSGDEEESWVPSPQKCTHFGCRSNTLKVGDNFCNFCKKMINEREK